MALTKDEIKARVVQRLAPKYRAGLTWAQLVAGVGAATTLQKAELVQMARDNEAAKLGSALIALVQAHLAVARPEQRVQRPVARPVADERARARRAGQVNRDAGGEHEHIAGEVRRGFSCSGLQQL